MTISKARGNGGDFRTDAMAATALAAVAMPLTILAYLAMTTTLALMLGYDYADFKEFHAFAGQWQFWAALPPIVWIASLFIVASLESDREMVAQRRNRAGCCR